jgi:hypothetical protein
MSPLRQIALAGAGCFSLLAGLAGCIPDRPEEISPNAVMETSGDRTVTWTASSSGKMTVYDQNTGKIVYGATVHDGQSVRVDADNNRISLDGQVVNENSLHGGDQYKIFFEPTSRVEKTSTVETNTVETVHQP